MTDLVWTALTLIAKRFRPRSPGEMRGQFFIADDKDRSAIELCLNDFDNTGMTVRGNLAAAVVGRSVELEFMPKPGWASVSATMDDLLQETRNRIRAKERYLVLNTKESSDDAQDEKTEVGKYQLVVKLVQAFKDVAGFLDSDEQSLVFISNGRFDLPVNYSLDDLNQMNVAEVRALTTLVPSDTHKKQCAAMLATAIVDLVRSQPAASRFSYLLRHATELRTAYEQGYKIYAAGFSYEKLKDTVEAARIEYVGKIHKVLSDIQNQLLGIPVATIIVATQMKDAKGLGTEFFVNSAVLLGCWVFVVLTGLLIWNQVHTLGVLEAEIARQKRQLEKEYLAVAGGVGNAFGTLAARAFTQKVILFVVGGFLVAGLVLAHISYFKLTPDAWAHMASYVSATQQSPAPAASEASSGAAKADSAPNANTASARSNSTSPVPASAPGTQPSKR
ncbi:hypothetical protein [Comamonas sp.]|uniref:hypothetical protein n=1 Tax=Comamonas sp. TaxID=34028 RepID=UPI0028AD01EF|nr:hypothetical protein [Comamonas sp.]